MKMIILAAGLGTRMRESMGSKPKILADLGGETILDRLLALGRELRLDPMIVTRPEFAADFRNVPAEVLVEEQPVGLLTTLYQTRDLIHEPFVWVGGDMVFSETGPLRELVEAHRPEDFASFLVCRTDRFKAKIRFEPELEFALTREGDWSLSLPTFVVQSHRLFSLMEVEGVEPDYPLMPALAAGETMAFRDCFPKVFEIDTPLDLAEARAHLAGCASIS
ncbi:MAG TPA: NTP transferase domain-containing protein [Thermoanaerobaculia bacterium]|nr:NTP transferase domain-containing protein [Thermoanaerobaculia bacterium]